MNFVDLSKFYVVTVISNPVRYKSRINLYKNFAKHMEDSGVQLYTVEAAYGDRPFEITEPNNPFHIQLRTHDEVWHKENMINIGISRLPADWEYVAWIDADISFARPDWAHETVQQLQHHFVVQLFSIAQDLGPNFEPFQSHNGFVYSHINGLPGPMKTKGYGTHWHPGYAWAARREAIDALGGFGGPGLMDFPVLGAADHHMAMALLGYGRQSVPNKIHPNYLKLVLQWEERALKYLHKDIGYVPGLILHYFHGKKKDRRYVERWSILIDNKFDPEADLKRDWHGLWQLSDRSIPLRDQIRAYFRARREDSIDLDP